MTGPLLSKTFTLIFGQMLGRKIEQLSRKRRNPRVYTAATIPPKASISACAMPTLQSSKPDLENLTLRFALLMRLADRTVFLVCQAPVGFLIPNSFPASPLVPGGEEWDKGFQIEVSLRVLQILSLWHQRPDGKRTENDALAFYGDMERAFPHLLDRRRGDAYQNLMSDLQGHIEEPNRQK